MSKVPGRTATDIPDLTERELSIIREQLAQSLEYVFIPIITLLSPWKIGRQN